MDYVGSEAIEDGAYCVKNGDMNSDNYGLFWNDDKIQTDNSDVENYKMLKYCSTFTVEDLTPIFSFPVLYPSESIEMMKESDHIFCTNKNNSINLGVTDKGYDVMVPLDSLTKHAFISGVPGAGKTNTMFHILKELWGKYHVPFIVFESAKREYRELLNDNCFKEIGFFSPSLRTRFPIHINPFQFPHGITLDEHLTNLEIVFKGAFDFPNPGPFILRESLLRAYKKYGWEAHTVNNGETKYPTMTDLYDEFKSVISEYKYDSEISGNIESILQVRIGSLMDRTGGYVYNVCKSTIAPEEWLERPVILELEQLGKNQANFMVLLICAFIREALGARELNRKRDLKENKNATNSLNHVIFIEEAHNLIGVQKVNRENNADPKVAASNFIVDMLAEVRNLGEGIVISDQLPSVMAPEVLKNTSLKIGHRLTAKDDREVLGSTMASTPEQLEEQIIFQEGDSFVFFEGLVKSCRVKINKWNPSINGSYAKGDDELFEQLATSNCYDYYAKMNANIAITNFGRCLGELFKQHIAEYEANEFYLKESNAALRLLKLFEEIYAQYKKFVGMCKLYIRQSPNNLYLRMILGCAKAYLLQHTAAFLKKLHDNNLPEPVMMYICEYIDPYMNFFKNNNYYRINKELVRRFDEAIGLLDYIFNIYYKKK